MHTTHHLVVYVIREQEGHSCQPATKAELQVKMKIIIERRAEEPATLQMSHTHENLLLQNHCISTDNPTGYHQG
jgi:hypothetical protein